MGVGSKDRYSPVCAPPFRHSWNSRCLSPASGSAGHRRAHRAARYLVRGHGGPQTVPVAQWAEQPEQGYRYRFEAGRGQVYCPMRAARWMRSAGNQMSNCWVAPIRESRTEYRPIVTVARRRVTPNSPKREGGRHATNGPCKPKRCVSNTLAQLRWESACSVLRVSRVRFLLPAPNEAPDGKRGGGVVGGRIEKFEKHPSRRQGRVRAVPRPLEQAVPGGRKGPCVGLVQDLQERAFDREVRKEPLSRSDVGIPMSGRLFFLE